MAGLADRTAFSFFFYSSILWNIIFNLIHDGCINRKKEKSSRTEVGFLFNFCLGWFFFFSIDTPINSNHDGCINRKEKKSAQINWKRKRTSVRVDFSFFLLIHPPWIRLIGVSIEKKKKTPWTGVGFLIQNRFICDCMGS